MKILLVRISSLGDVLHNLPVVDDLLAHFPDASIDWVVEEAYVNLVKLHPKVRQVFPVALRRWRKKIFDAKNRQEIADFITLLQSERYDLILETQGLFKTGILMGLAKTTPNGKKVGLANGTEGSGYEAVSRWFHDQSIPVDRKTHAVLRGRQVAAAACAYTLSRPVSFGMQRSDLTPACLPASDFVVFFHATAGASKKWAESNWITIAAFLAEKNLPVLLPWGNPAEKEVAQRMAQQMPNATVLPQLSMQDAIILAQKARLAIGVDTGLTHIAAAYETPTIEIYCDSPRWKTEGNWSDKIINLGDQGHPPSALQVQQAISQLLQCEASK